MQFVVYRLVIDFIGYRLEKLGLAPCLLSLNV